MSKTKSNRFSLGKMFKKLSSGRERHPGPALSKVASPTPPEEITASGEDQSLWTKAFCSKKLDPGTRKTLSGVVNAGVDGKMTVATLDAIQENIRSLIAEKTGKAWKIEWGEEDIVLRDVGMKILQAVDKFKEIGDLVVQFDPVHAALPWAAFRLLLQMCVSGHEKGGKILIGLESVGYLIARCAIYEELYLRKAADKFKHLEEVLVDLYASILRFLATSIASLRDSALKGVITNAKLAEHLQELKELGKTVSEHAQTAEAQNRELNEKELNQKASVEFTKLRELLNDLETATVQMNNKVNDIHNLVQGSRRFKLLEWLSTIPYTNHHSRISETRLKDTGEWLFSKDEYKEWRHSSVSKLLLLRGIPGAGKTYIASKVVDRLQEEYRRPKTIDRLAYFYCNRAEESRRTPTSILHTLIQQLAQSDDTTIVKEVAEMYEGRERNGQASAKLSLGESQKVLVGLTNFHRRTTICIDALDEVDKNARAELLDVLKQVIDKSENLVKIFATSRNDPDILHQFALFPRIDLQPDDNQGDINQFIKEKVEDAIKHKRLPDALKCEILDALRNRCRGMFQLAALQITLICEKKGAWALRRSLNELPKDLKMAYEAICEEIQKEGNYTLALNTFRWVKYSYEPLASKALVDAAGVEVGESGEFFRDQSLTKHDILEVCKNLLVYDEGLDVFRFAHLSVEEYLEASLPTIESHTYITEVCLSLLSCPDYAVHYDLSITTWREQYKNRHLLLYSSVFWPWHFSQSETAPNSRICGISTEFITGESCEKWRRYISSVVEYSYDDIFWNKAIYFVKEGRNGLLSFSSIFGFCKLFEVALESLPVVESTLLQTYIFLAARFGYLEMMKYLLEKGTNMSAAGIDGDTPLHVAAWNGHEDIARLLIEKGADVSAANDDGHTPLHVAAGNGHEEIARMLIEKGADVSAAGNDGDTPLHVALRNGHEDIARLLIEKGADVSAADKYGETPLHLAISSRGHEEIARLLIEKGADVSAADNNGYTPLHSASTGDGHEDIARLLIEKGADVSAADNYGETPLHSASTGDGHEDIARLLIEKSADVSAASCYGETPLHVAMRRGHENIARLLIEKGADVSAADKFGETPLKIAFEEGQEQLIQLLREKGADE